MIHAVIVPPLLPGLIFNFGLILVFLHILVSSVKWLIVHHKNGWAYGLLPALVSAYGIAFQTISVLSKTGIAPMDPIFLNYMAQASALLISIGYAVSLRLHLRCLRACGAV